MSPETDRRASLIVIGAGPIGLEAALYAAALGYEVSVLEAGRVGEHVARWGHLTMFSPWDMNCSPLGLRYLDRADARPFQDGDPPPTGSAFVRRYLEPLAASPLLRGRVSTGARVIQVARDGILKGELIGDPRRRRHPFRLLVERQGEESVHHADLLIDASGTYGQPRWLGSGGIPAPGERAASQRIDYHPVDLAGNAARRFAGRRILLVGSGHSAAGSALALERLVHRAPDTRVVWALRGSGRALYRPLPGDPLPGRARLCRAAGRIAHGAVPGIQPLPRSSIEAIERLGNGPRASLRVTLRSAGRMRRILCDRILANVGYRPDAALYAELQMHACYASDGPMKLAATLLGESGAGGDCLAQPVVGADRLTNPEPGFFILGSKSYGRNPDFLLRTGREQVRALFAMLCGDPDLDLFRSPRGPALLRRRAAHPPTGAAARP